MDEIDSKRPSTGCLVYGAFHECVNGNNCKLSHDISTCEVRVAEGTVITKIEDASGIVTFLMNNTSGQSYEKFYVSRGRWFNSGAAPGDSVELQISENVNLETGCCFARISKILKLSTKTPTVRLGSFHRNRSDCWEFYTYSDCRFQVRCRRSHDINCRCDQSFHVAKICSVTETCYEGYEVKVVKMTGVNKAYYVPRGEYWYLKNATAENLVIIQESTAIYRRTHMNYGKICVILHGSQDIDETRIPVEVNLRYGFTFVDKSRHQRKTVLAFSTTPCLDHEDCKRIGVHIRATAIGDHYKKMDRNFVPFYKTHPRDQADGFMANSIQLGVSVYSHSASDQIEQPVLTALFIHVERFLDIDDQDICRDYVKDMWKLFAKDSYIDDVSSTVASLLLVNSPSTWRPKLITRNSVNFFNEQITVYLRSKVGKSVVANYARSEFSIPDEEIVIPDEVIDNIDLAWKSRDSTVDESEDALAHLLGSAKRTDKQFWRGYDGWYTSFVTSCNTLTDMHIVITTSPIGQTSNYVNQQILLAFMISPSISLYSENEMIGIVIRRYETPIIQKAVLRKIRKDYVHLQFIGVHGRARGERIMLIRDLFGRETSESLTLIYSSEDHEDSEEKDLLSISFMMQNQTCDEYYNTKLAVLQGEKLTALAATVKKHGIDSLRTVDCIHEIVAAKSIDDTPYAAIKGGGTKVTLRRGTELQLQLAIKSEFDEDERDTYLRLLRIGKDCHDCLAHLNNPESAFLSSHRRDVRDLLSQEFADKVFKNIRKTRAKTVIFRKKRIIWDDYYFSGGKFLTGESDVKRSNLLCIRREILPSNESEISFVWICHAVVSKLSDGEVIFLVCSLYQEQTPDIIFRDDTEFIVEVVDVDYVKVNADQCSTEHQRSVKKMCSDS